MTALALFNLMHLPWVSHSQRSYHLIRTMSTTTLFGIDLATLQRRVHEQAWAAAIYAGVRERAEALRDLGVRIPAPDDPSGWKHNFTCPHCAVLLRFDLNAPKQHHCELCGGTFSTPEMNAAWVYQLNQYQIERAVESCIVAAVEGDAWASQLAREVLLGYARRYLDYPEHGKNAGVGRVQGQSLDEAVWMLPAMQVYLTLRALGHLDTAEQKLVADNMFAPACELLRRQTSEIHNIHVWHASAIFSIAQELGRDDDRAFAEEHLRRNLEEGVLPDGSWYEGSPHYHFYTVEAFSAYALAAKAAGQPLVHAERFEKMFRSPLLLLQPDYQLPAFNDGWPENPLTSRASHYEVGHYLFGGFEEALHTIYNVCGAPRQSVEALLYGPETIEEKPLRWPRFALVDGVAVVRRSPLVGYVKATPCGGGHDHPDKPGLYFLFEDSTLKAADIGNPGYGNSLHRAYYRTTVSHNTVMADGEDQRLADAAIIHTEERDDYTLVTAQTDKAYPGVTIVRTCVFGDGWVLDWTRATAETAHDYLWLFHANGPFRFLTNVLAYDESEFIPNEHVVNQRSAPSPPREVRGLWTERGDKPGRLHVQLWRPQDNSALIGMAQAPDLPATEHVDLLAAGCWGTALDVLAFFVPGLNEQAEASIKILQRTPERVEVAITPQPGQQPIHLLLAAR